MRRTPHAATVRTRSSRETVLSASQPRVATRSPRASIPATMRSPQRSAIARASSGLSTSSVPITTAFAPAAKRAATSSALRMPPPVCTGTPDRRADRAQRGLILAGSERAVEVDDVQRARAFRDERARSRDRIGVVPRLARRVAALEAHGVAAAQVDRGIDRQRARAQAAAIRK